MKFELTKWNIDKALKELEGIKGKSIMIGNIHLSGVNSISIDTSEVYDCDPDPSINYDGGKRELIDITFSYDNGTASTSFCPDEDICHFWHEETDFIIFKIQSIPSYVEKESFELNFRLEQYNKYMSE